MIGLRVLLVLCMSVGVAVPRSHALDPGLLKACKLAHDEARIEKLLVPCRAVVGDSEALRSDRAFAHRALGWAHSSLGQAELAIDSYTAALKADPSHAEAHKGRAVVYWKSMKDLPRALKDLNAAIRIDPGYLTAYFLRSEVHEKMGHKTLAIQDLEAMIGAKGSGREGSDDGLDKGLAQLRLNELQQAK